MSILILLLAMSVIHPISSTVRIDYNTGTIIRSGKNLNAGYTKMNLLIHIPRIKNITLQRYKQPCDFMHMLIDDLVFYNITNPQYTDALTDFDTLCHRNAKLRKTSLALRRIYEQHVSTMRNISTDLVPTTNRTKRSIFSSIRHAFGIADYDKQKTISKTVQQITADLSQQQGTINGLNYAMVHVSRRIKHLYESTETLVSASNKMSKHIDQLTRNANAKTILEKYNTFLTADTIQSGVIQNQYLARYSNIIEQRLAAISTLARGFLPPELVTPHELDNILSNLEQAMRSQHPLLQIEHNSVYDYYSMNNIISFMENDDIIIKIPVTISLHDQTFELYKLQSFVIPVLNMHDQAMITHHKEMIAVNRKAETYFSLNEDELNNCHGHINLICPQLFTQHIMKRQSCELSILKGNLEVAKDLCEFGLINIQSLDTKFYYISDNNVLTVNPMRSKIYKRCKHDKMQKFISNEFVFEIRLECFCYVFSDQSMSPIFADDNCHENTTIDIHYPSENILYIALLLNESMIDINDYNISSLIPTLELPELPIDFRFENDILDLKSILYAREDKYANTVMHQLDKHNGIFASFYYIKSFIFYALPFILTGIIILLIVFVCKTKNLGKLMSIAALMKTTDAAPIMKTTREIIDITTDSVILLLALLAILYIILRYFKLYMIFKKYITLPFNSCIIMNPDEPRLEIIIYLESIHDYVMLFVDSIQYTPPGNIKLNQSELQILFTLHSSCCTNYLTINKELLIEVVNSAQDTYKLPNAVHIPLYLKDKVDQILNDTYKAKLLIGSGGIYFNHDLE